MKWWYGVHAWRACARWLLLASFLAGSLAARADNLLHADHALAGKIWDMRERRWLDEPALLERIAAAEVLLLGETHDNPQHHALQLKLLQARLGSGARPALLFEQYDRERQTALDAALEKTPAPAALEAAAALMKGWDWKFYQPLLAAALDYRLPVYAANFSREQARPVIRQGFGAYDADELKRLAVDAVWDDKRQQYMSGLIEGTHCGQVDAALRDGLVRSQRLRDAVMADVAAAAASQGRGTVGIVGRGHARRDTGMPLYLAARYPQLRSYAIGLVEVSPDKLSPEDYERDGAGDGIIYDAMWFTARVDRPDPCASFGKK